MYPVVLIFLCTLESLAVPSIKHNVISSEQCLKLDGLIRSLGKGQTSAATVRDFLSDQKIAATEKACVGPTCEGSECCRCCCHGTGQCCTVQQWANDFGVTASLSSEHAPNLCTCSNGTPASGARCVLSSVIKPCHLPALPSCYIAARSNSKV